MHWSVIIMLSDCSFGCFWNIVKGASLQWVNRLREMWHVQAGQCNLLPPAQFMLLYCIIGYKKFILLPEHWGCIISVYVSLTKTQYTYVIWKKVLICFWLVTPCSSERAQYFGGTCHHVSLSSNDGTTWILHLYCIYTLTWFQVINFILLDEIKWWMNVEFGRCTKQWPKLKCCCDICTERLWKTMKNPLSG
jgi:hypothetical protein